MLAQLASKEGFEGRKMQWKRIVSMLIRQRNGANSMTISILGTFFEGYHALECNIQYKCMQKVENFGFSFLT